MPIYEYRCTGCEHQFDALQKMSDAPLETCPQCSNSTLVKLVSAPSFRLSGSGWYETDFKTSKDKKKNLADNKPQTNAETAQTSSSKPGKSEKMSSKA